MCSVDYILDLDAWNLYIYIYTNRRLLPGSTEIRTKINPCVSKLNPWGPTRSHCWTTTLPWPTTSARNGPSHQSLWPRFWANVLSPDFFVNGHLSSTSSFLTFFLGKEIFHFFGQRPCEHFFDWWETAAARPRLQGFLLSFTHLHLLLTRSLLENLPAAKNRRSTSKNIDWRIKEANMFTTIHKAWTIRSPAAMPMPEALDCTKAHHRMVESSTI